LALGTWGPVVNNDGVHGVRERVGVTYLPAGRVPVRVEWFNADGEGHLELKWSGPGQPPERVPPSAWWRKPSGADDAGWVHGLEYEAVAATDEALPAFEGAERLRVGTCDDLNIGVVPRSARVGVRFQGWLEVPRAGVYRFFLRSDDGSQFHVGGATFRTERLGAGRWPEVVALLPGQPLHAAQERLWARLEGTVTAATPAGRGLRLELSGGAARVRVWMATADAGRGAAVIGRRVRVTGFCLGAELAEGARVPGLLLVPGDPWLEVVEEPSRQPHAEAADQPRPLLRTAGQVHRLKRAEAEERRPVRLRGVVTCVLPEHQAVTVQDATRGIYVEDHTGEGGGLPEVGDWVEVEGVTDPGLFAPLVHARRLERKGLGILPVAVVPTWDQLLSGSLDAQYVEVAGVVTRVQSNTVALLLREGVLRVELRVPGWPPARFAEWENALIRVRGTLFASWDYVTHQFRPGAARIYGADVTVLEPPPADVFSAAEKSLAELRLFDPQGGQFRRVRVTGQVLHLEGTELFMADAGVGLRCLLRPGTNRLEVGERIEVVGFPEVSGMGTPMLREAVWRKIGRASLPAPALVTPTDFNNRERDATWVRVEGVLVDRRRTDSGWVLEVQNGVRTFAARCARPEPLPAAAIGSRIELTGVYAALSGRRADGPEAGAFEVLLASPAAVQVLARPPWWTLERLLVVLSVLAGVLVLATLWITQLHRQVEQRSVALEKEIRARQQLEQQRALEQERARVAQDLHDELGSDLTEVSMLLARAQAAATPPERRAGYLAQTAEKTRQMVTALDEIVWAMNPRHDTLGSLTSYFCLHADRFLGLAGIAWRLEEGAGPSETPVDSRRRHQLFLAFKEMLTNVVRHARATEVRFALRRVDNGLELVVRDNGQGVPPGPTGEGRDGLANLRARCERLGGAFHVESRPGQGTTVRVFLPAG
jgi:signal transduction histidine kinase